MAWTSSAISQHLQAFWFTFRPFWLQAMVIFWMVIIPRWSRAGCGWLEHLAGSPYPTAMAPLISARWMPWTSARESGDLSRRTGGSRVSLGGTIGKNMDFLGKTWDFPARFPSNESNDMGSFFWVGKAWFMCGSSSKGLRCNQHAPPYSKKFVRTGGTSQSLGKKAIFMLIILWNYTLKYMGKVFSRNREYYDGADHCIIDMHLGPFQLNQRCSALSTLQHLAFSWKNDHFFQISNFLERSTIKRLGFA